MSLCKCVVCDKEYSPYFYMPHAKISMGINPLDPNEISEHRYCKDCFQEQLQIRKAAQ